MMRQELTALLRRGRCGGRALERVMGHRTFVGLASRAMLCTFHTCYRCMQSRYFESGMTCWPSCDASGGSFCFCPYHGGYPGILASSKAMPACWVGHWHSLRQFHTGCSSPGALVAALSDGHWRPRENLGHRGMTKHFPRHFVLYKKQKTKE